jgi:hypothetical protein
MSDRLLMLCQTAVDDARSVAQLVPLVLEHSSRGGPRLPVSGTGGGRRTGSYADPTGDMACALAMLPSQPEELDNRALLETLHAFALLNRAATILAGMHPEAAGILDVRADVAIHAGSEPLPTTAVVVCPICLRLTSGLRARLCGACHAAWRRAGQTDVGRWAVERRRYLRRAAAERAELERLKQPTAD